VLVILIGNKCDLEADREVSTQEGELLAKVYFISFFPETCQVLNKLKYFVNFFGVFKKKYIYIIYSRLLFVVVASVSRAFLEQ